MGRLRDRHLFAAVGLLISLVMAAPADADGCEFDGEAGFGQIDLGGQCDNPGAALPGASGDPIVPTQSSSFSRYKWVSICFGSPTDAANDVPDCPQSLGCNTPEARRYQLWGLQRAGGWQRIRQSCFEGTPPPFVPETVTPGAVLEALRNVGLPSHEVITQPGGSTLVNLETNFYTDPRPIDIDLTILGQAVRVQAEPVQFAWEFGDGASATTTSPGDNYPNLVVTHKYVKRGPLTASVTAYYRARFSVSGGPLQTIATTIPVAGQPTPLAVKEATPLLTGG